MHNVVNVYLSIWKNSGYLLLTKIIIVIFNSINDLAPLKKQFVDLQKDSDDASVERWNPRHR